MGERGVISERGRGTGGGSAICMRAALCLSDFRWPLGDVEGGAGVASGDGGSGSDFGVREGNKEAQVAGTRFACPLPLFFGNFQWQSGDVEAGEGVASADGGTGSNFRAREGNKEAQV